jgi:hypothetical protein
MGYAVKNNFHGQALDLISSQIGLLKNDLNTTLKKPWLAALATGK